MSKIKLNPECWNCGNTVSNDKVCPKCGEYLDDDPELDEEWDGIYDEEEPGFGGITGREIMKTGMIFITNINHNNTSEESLF